MERKSTSDFTYLLSMYTMLLLFLFLLFVVAAAFSSDLQQTRASRDTDLQMANPGMCVCVCVHVCVYVCVYVCVRGCPPLPTSLLRHVPPRPLINFHFIAPPTLLLKHLKTR